VNEVSFLYFILENSWKIYLYVVSKCNCAQWAKSPKKQQSVGVYAPSYCFFLPILLTGCEPVKYIYNTYMNVKSYSYKCLVENTSIDVALSTEIINYAIIIFW